MSAEVNAIQSLSDLHKRRIRLHVRKQAIEAELRDINQEVCELETLAVNEMIDRGIANVSYKVDGQNYSVHIRRDAFVCRRDEIDADRYADELAAALVNSGDEWGYLVKPTVHSGALRSRIKEAIAKRIEESSEADAAILNDPDEAFKQAIPEPLRKVVRLAEVSKLGVRKV